MPISNGEYAYKAVAGELLVRIRPDASEQELTTLAASLGSKILGASARADLYRFTIPAGQTPGDFRMTLMDSDQILEARPHAIATASGCPTGEHRAKEWNLDRIGIDLACAQYATALSSVVIAVLDTGVAYEDYVDGSTTYLQAPGLAGVKFLPGYDFVNNDSHANDDHQHGTHIASLIGGLGAVPGTAPGVQLLPVKVLAADKQGTELQIVDGIYFAVDSGADVINLSLSFGLGYYPSSSLQDAIAYAIDNGVVVIGSAGNDKKLGLSYPGAFPDVIGVGASRLKNKGGVLGDGVAHYTNRGYGMDLLAPGGMLNTDMNKDGQPDAILGQSIAKNDPTNFGYWYYTGTSQAAAQVSGAAAWLLADGALPSEVRPALLESADPMGKTKFAKRVAAGVLRVQDARDLVAAGPIPSAPQYYVNLIAWLETGVDGGTQAVARVEVIDSDGNPASDVTVGGSWFGTTTKLERSGVTGLDGVVEMISPEHTATSGVAVGFQVTGIATPGSLIPSRPLQYYSLTPATAELFSRLLADSTFAGTITLYKLDTTDAALDTLLNRATLQNSWLMKPLGAGSQTGPLVIVFDDTFAPEVTQPVSGTMSAQLWTFDAPLYSGRGNVTDMSGTLVTASSPSLGSATRFLILPLDPAMASVDPANCYPVVNAAPGKFLAVNQAVGNGFASSPLGTGFASSSLGTGFASSSLGTGFASSSLGDGFASSSLGTGFASSALGTGFASSALGTGFASSALGTGFASSSLGTGFASSALASGVADGVAMPTAAEGLVGTGLLNLNNVDPTTLITDETLLPSEDPLQ